MPFWMREINFVLNEQRSPPSGPCVLGENLPHDPQSCREGSPHGFPVGCPTGGHFATRDAVHIRQKVDDLLTWLFFGPAVLSLAKVGDRAAARRLDVSEHLAKVVGVTPMVAELSDRLRELPC
jgi:hypothetical protein